VKYVVEFESGERYEIELDPSHPENVLVGGRPHRVDVQGAEGGAVVTTEDGSRALLKLAYQDGQLTVDGPEGSRQRVRVVQAETEAWRKAVCAEPPIKTSIVPDELGAPIPGHIAGLLVADGSLVAEGQGILVVEAMKMQNTITAPKAGVIRFAIKQGQTVRAGDLMATITRPESN
jgi:biotin carboxyl carrier protein